ncbi:MAG: hypothetical protein H8D23_21290 [Candidatus Brocadiales bacterium]|nr:hypothetical protein [Candidatus Brocadiales bacterium]
MECICLLLSILLVGSSLGFFLIEFLPGCQKKNRQKESLTSEIVGVVNKALGDLRLESERYITKVRRAIKGG